MTAPTINRAAIALRVEVSDPAELKGTAGLVSRTGPGLPSSAPAPSTQSPAPADATVQRRDSHPPSVDRPFSRGGLTP